MAKMFITGHVHRLFVGLCLLSFVASCADETVSGYLPSKDGWALVQMGNAPFAGNLMLEFPRKGRIKGIGSCSQFQADQTAPYPWFSLSDLSVNTDQNCPTAEEEQNAVAQISRMSLAEISGNTLILSDDAGLEMFFQNAQN